MHAEEDRIKSKIKVAFVPTIYLELEFLFRHDVHDRKAKRLSDVSAAVL